MAGRVVTIAAGTTTIKADAYQDQDDIVEVIFPASLLTIEEMAFMRCSGITRIDLAHTKVTAIGVWAFYRCTSLAEVIFPDTLVHMEDGCFRACAAITAADLSTTKVATLADYTFYDCASLFTVKMPAALTAIGLQSFAGCRALAGVDFTTSLTTIGPRAFARCSALTDLRIPASVATVRGLAFSGCTALRTVAMESAEVRFTPFNEYGVHNHFSGCTSLAAISVPDLDHAMATWPHDKMFPNCPTLLPTLLAAAAAGMQLQYYWTPGREGHAVCLPGARTAVCTVLLVAARLMHRWRASAHSAAEHGQRRTPHQAQHAPLPDLPDELWFCILRLVRRHEIGGAAV